MEKVKTKISHVIDCLDFDIHSIEQHVSKLLTLLTHYCFFPLHLLELIRSIADIYSMAIIII